MGGNGTIKKRILGATGLTPNPKRERGEKSEKNAEKSAVNEVVEPRPSGAAAPRGVNAGAMHGAVHGDVLPVDSTMFNMLMKKLDKLDILDTLKADVQELKVSVEFCHSSVTEIKKDNELMRQQINSLTADLAAAKKDSQENRERLLDQQWRGMKYNLIFHGLPELANEDCYQIIRKFIEKELDFKEKAAEIEFGNVHRFGVPKNGKRPIVARFLRFQERDAVRSASYKLAGKPFGISEQVPPEWAESRRQLMPQYKEAKKANQKARFVKDMLVVNGQVVRAPRK